MFFPVENSHFGRLKSEKHKKRSSPLVFTTFSLFITFLLSFLPFPLFHLPFYNFPSFFLNFHPFSLFSLPLFPDTSAKISRSEVSGGTLPPAPPPACYATAQICILPHQCPHKKFSGAATE